MYKFISKEVNGEQKRSIVITRQDALKVKEFANNDNIKFVVSVLNKVSENNKKEEFLEFDSEDIMAFLVSEDWLYNYDIFNNLSLEELKIGITNLEQRLFDEQLKLKKVLELSLADYSNIMTLNQIFRNMNKYNYQIDTIETFAKEKYHVNLKEFEIKTR